LLHDLHSLLVTPCDDTVRKLLGIGEFLHVPQQFGDKRHLVRIVNVVHRLHMIHTALESKHGVRYHPEVLCYSDIGDTILNTILVKESVRKFYNFRIHSVLGVEGVDHIALGFLKRLLDSSE
jgi:hypothetical protein